LPPGPPSHPALQTYRCIRAPFAFLEDCAARYGRCFTVRFLRQPPFVFLNDPDILREIFSAPSDVVRAGEGNAAHEFALGANSLFRLDGERHERERKLLMPPFHGERMAAYLGQILAVTDRTIDRIDQGETFSLHRMMQAITLDGFIECIFGVSPGPRQDRFRELLGTFVQEAAKAYVGLLVMLFPGAELRGFLAQRAAPVAERLRGSAIADRLLPIGPLARCIRDLDRLIYDDIAARRAAGTRANTDVRRPDRREGADASTDVMSLLIAARDEQGRGLTDAELHDEMLTLLIAGHETTATALTFAVSKVLDAPRVLARVRQELGAVVGGRPLTPERLRDLPYLDATIKEVLRLYGPASGFVRRLAKPMRLGSYDLPEGTTVSASTYLLHRDPQIWRDPSRLDPERFLERRVRPSEYVPFGGGTRTCLGMAFALFMTKAVLCRLVSRTELEAARGPAAELALRGLIFGPSHEVPMVLKSRAKAVATGTISAEPSA
jgi:cytochrome P450